MEDDVINPFNPKHAVRAPSKRKPFSQQSELVAELLSFLVPNEASEDLENFFKALNLIKVQHGKNQTLPLGELDEEIKISFPFKRSSESSSKPYCLFLGYRIVFLGGYEYPVYEVNKSGDKAVFRLLPVSKSDNAQKAIDIIKRSRYISFIARGYAVIDHPLGQIEFVERTDHNLQEVTESWHPGGNESKLTIPQKKRLLFWLNETYENLEGLYAKGIVFTDIKPGNLFVIGKRIVFSDTKSLQMLPLTGIPPLTRAYTPPEIDAITLNRSDQYHPFLGSLYALAITSCELLTGSRSLSALTESHNTKDKLGKHLLIKIQRWSHNTPQQRYQGILMGDLREVITLTENLEFWRSQGAPKRVGIPQGIIILKRFFSNTTTQLTWKNAYTALLESKSINDDSTDQYPLKHKEVQDAFFSNRKPLTQTTFTLCSAIQLMALKKAQKARELMQVVKQSITTFNLELTRQAAALAKKGDQTLTAPGAEDAEKDALSYYEQSSRLKSDPETLIKISKVHLLSGRYQEALQMSKSVLKMTPEKGKLSDEASDISQICSIYLRGCNLKRGFL